MKLAAEQSQLRKGRTLSQGAGLAQSRRRWKPPGASRRRPSPCPAASAFWPGRSSNRPTGFTARPGSRRSASSVSTANAAANRPRRSRCNADVLANFLRKTLWVALARSPDTSQVGKGRHAIERLGGRRAGGPQAEHRETKDTLVEPVEMLILDPKATAGARRARRRRGISRPARSAGCRLSPNPSDAKARRGELGGRRPTRTPTAPATTTSRPTRRSPATGGELMPAHCWPWPDASRTFCRHASVQPRAG